MNADAEKAELRQLEVCLEEVEGVRPAGDLGERILEEVRRRDGAEHLAAAGVRTQHRGLWVAAVVVGGLTAVMAIAWLGRRDAGEPAAPTRKPQETERQESAEVQRLIRQLELPARRADATAKLVQVGHEAAGLLRTAIAEEKLRGRAGLVQVYQSVLGLVDNSYRKQLAGLPADQPLTLICDYSENNIGVFDANGKRLGLLQNVYGVWDAELTPGGTLLVAEFSVSRVTERTMDGKILWSFEQVRNPYDADRLTNGNTLICDTFGGRVIEVDPTGKVVWKLGGVRPFDADRLPNDNTLVCDVLHDRVVEVDRTGREVWSWRAPNAHDADRLPNGNTLITLRTQNRVVEVDPAGQEVWSLSGLGSPSDADRLPDGHTIVAENGRVREFDAAGRVLADWPATWAVEVNRY